MAEEMRTTRRRKKILIVWVGLTVVMTTAITTYQRESSGKRRITGLLSTAGKVAENESGNWINRAIPKILHQVFSSEMVHSNYQPLIATCLKLNPDWKYYLWRDTDAEALIVDRFPGFAARNRQYGDPLQRSDSIRYIVMYLFGGIYIDMDVECRQPFLPTLANVPAFLDKEREEQTRILWNQSYFVMNSGMGAHPGHPFFLEVIEAMVRVDHKTFVLYSTGPALLTQVFNRVYQGSNLTGLPPMKLLDCNIMSPLMDRHMNWPDLCNGTEDAHRKPYAARSWKERGCVTLRSKNWSLDDSDSSTIATHRFFHLGYSGAGSMRKQPFNLTQEFGSRVNYYLQERAARTT